jgi:hypothetical protein
MTIEPEKRKITVNKPPQYLEVPVNDVPAPIIANGSDPNGRNGGTIGLRPADDVKDQAGDLIGAIQTVFRVVTARIAYHEREAQRLREALAPFANHARQSAAPVTPSDGATVEALLRIADQLNQQGESQ